MSMGPLNVKEIMARFAFGLALATLLSLAVTVLL
jgi:hypothetical protein